MSSGALPSTAPHPPPPDPFYEVDRALGGAARIGFRYLPMFESMLGGLEVVDPDGRVLATLGRDLAVKLRAMRWTVWDPARRPLISFQLPPDVRSFHLVMGMQVIEPYQGTAVGTFDRGWGRPYALLRPGRLPLNATGPGISGSSPFPVLAGSNPVAQVSYPHRFLPGTRATTGLDIDFDPAMVDPVDRGAVVTLIALICTQARPPPTPFMMR